MVFYGTSGNPPPRPARHGRHGRVGRSSVLRPPLPHAQNRWEMFNLVTSSAFEYLRGGWPELRDVRVEVASLPKDYGTDGVPRWEIDRHERLIVLYRIAIERLLPPGHDDAFHKRLALETALLRAAAEYAGRDLGEFGM